MNNTALISLIIPCYNAESTISKCLQSVITQSYENLQIIVIDDGSTDKSSEIIAQYQLKDDRIILHQQINSGVSKARNKGIELSTGDYICFVDSDDWVEKDYCSVLYKSIVENNADISIAEAIIEDKNNKQSTIKKTTAASLIVYDKLTALKLLLEDKVIQSHPWAKLYKSTLLKDIFFPENLEAFEDYFIMFHVFNSAEKVVKIDSQVYHYIQLPTSLSHNLTPKRAYHFFLALMEVSAFLEKLNIDSQSRYSIVKNLLKKSFMVLKRIIRNTNLHEMSFEKELIRSSLTPYLKYSVFKIGLENYFYLRFFINFPKKYNQFIKK